MYNAPANLHVSCTWITWFAARMRGTENYGLKGPYQRIAVVLLFVSVVSFNPDGRLAFSDLVHGVLSTWLKMMDMS